MRLSVFSGGFTREAAAAVAAADRNHLRSFSSKALIEIVEGDRYDIHELLCQFGAEKLAAGGEEAGTKAQHAAYFAAFMAECWGGIRTNRQLEALERIAADFENVRAAWLYTLHQGNSGAARRSFFTLCASIAKCGRLPNSLSICSNMPCRSCAWRLPHLRMR